MLSIIIVNWNTKDLLRKCLQSIYKETKDLDFEIFVVDNGSKDSSVEFLKTVDESLPPTVDPPKAEKTSSTRIRDIEVILNKKNLGFARASNQGIRKARGDYILLLNPDTIILENTFSKMIRFLEENPKVGILGPKILNPDGSLQPSCRTFPTLASQVLILLKLHNLFPKFYPIRKYYMLDFDHNQTKEVDQVMGSCFMIRKKLLDEIGLLDENYWIWFEEVDYCRRAKQAGWKVYFLPQACIIHHKAKAFEQMSGVKKQIKFLGSLLYYFKKFHTRPVWLTILSLYPLSLFLALIVQFVQYIKPLKKKKYL